MGPLALEGAIWGDPWLRALVAWIPLLLGVWVCLLFQGGLVRELPIGLIDQDHPHCRANWPVRSMPRRP